MLAFVLKVSLAAIGFEHFRNQHSGWLLYFSSGREYCIQYTLQFRERTLIIHLSIPFQNKVPLVFFFLPLAHICLYECTRILTHSRTDTHAHGIRKGATLIDPLKSIVIFKIHTSFDRNMYPFFSFLLFSLPLAWLYIRVFFFMLLYVFFSHYIILYIYTHHFLSNENCLKLTWKRV